MLFRRLKYFLFRFRLSDPAAMSSESSSQYVWVNCRTQGWQALMDSNTIYTGVPEPPACVTQKISKSEAKPTSPKGLRARSPLSRSPKVSSIPKPRQPVTPRNPWQSVLYQPPSRSPSPKRGDPDEPLEWNNSLNQYPPSTNAFPASRNFIEENRTLDKPSRQSKRDLLEQASLQLQTSERLGAHLAERLNQLNTQLTPS
jgi:hypothetical protein